MKPFLAGVFAFLSFVSLACSTVYPIRDPFAEEAPEAAPGETAALSPLKILALDVGQGDATLVTGPTGRTLLIDAGPPGAGLANVLPALRAEGVESLDWIVATHYDADHIGGLPEVFQGEDGTGGTEDDVLPRRALVDRGEATAKTTPTYGQYLAAAPANRKEAEPGMILDLGGGAGAEVIVANGRYADGRSVHLNPDEENEASVGLLIRYGDFSYFTAGDLSGGGNDTKDLETFAGGIIGDVDVLHVAHHGSDTSSNEKFLALTRPEIALISVGADNDYGHPAPELLERLEDAGARVFRTDLLGDLEIAVDGADYVISDR